MYWADRGDGTFEIIDGQQRTISIAQYVDGVFSFENQYFHNLLSDIKSQILDYQLMVYVCSGTETEKLAWFRIINIAGQKLKDQELLNAIYAGSWVSDAKRHFSRRGSPVTGVGGDYLSGSSIRQDYLETAIMWISNGEIRDYMSRHQHDKSAKPLWDYFQSVINWIEATFTNREQNRKLLMKGLDWGRFYNDYKDSKLDPDRIEAEIAKLILDDDVQKKTGIYEYILTGEEKHLNIRVFELGMKHKVYEKQSGICKICGEQFNFSDMEADHIIPWSDGGKTIEANCQMLCKKCNREKSSK